MLLIGFAGVVYVHGSASAAQPTPSSHVAYNAKHTAPVPNGAHLLGHHKASAQIQVQIVLRPQNENNLYPLIQALSTPGNAQYQHWLTPAQFNAAFPAPAFDTKWLTSHGIRQIPGSSPLVLNFTGTSSQFEAAFNTTINDYRTTAGHTVYSNASEPSVPATAFPQIAGIVGLDNVTAGEVKPELAKPLKSLGKASLPAYGAGENGGLTPSQLQGIYNAPAIYKTTKGQGVTTAVFELSGYPEADIRAYEQAFGLPKTKIQNINIDGGACNDEVLEGLPCNYGASEVNIDIELQQAMAPGVSKIQVYLGPNSDQGVLDTYFAIANQNTASSISSSWGECEPALDSGVAYGEFLAFAQMALQGQSISAASGDNGSYDCLGEVDGPTGSANEVDDPASDPLMTALGGTSFFGTFDPDTNLHPTYPTGQEYVWNTLNNCSNSDFTVDGVDISEAFGGVLCPFGADGGGNSTLWAKPLWQAGPGTTSSASQFGAACGQHSGVQCREVPDISLNGDPNSGYAEYCSDPTCFDFFGSTDPWNQIGGTSTTAPLWSGIVALADSAGHHRIGLPTPALYLLNSHFSSSHALHDMVGGGSYPWNWSGFLSSITGTTITVPTVTIFTNRNGVGSPVGFSETSGYDMATGVGTPNVSALVPLLALFP